MAVFIIERKEIRRLQFIGANQELPLHTLERVGSFDSSICHNYSWTRKIVDWISKNSVNRPGITDLCHLFIGNNSENKQYIFRQVAIAAMPILHEFDARCLSNLIYAFGLAESVLEFLRRK